MQYLGVLLIISVLVLIHELGHYLAARAVGIPIQRLSVGIGGKIWGFRYGDTEYRVSTVPFGGYVLAGADGYFEHSPTRRLIFALGGPAANFLVAALLLGVFNCMLYEVSLQAFFVEPLRQTFDATVLIVGAIPRAFAGGDDPVGLIGVIAQGGDLVGGSEIMALQFAVVMSINLAVINLIPIPPLDGGRVVLCVLEKIHRGMTRLHVPLNVAGFAAILGFLTYTTALDIRRLILSFLV